MIQHRFANFQYCIHAKITSAVVSSGLTQLRKIATINLQHSHPVQVLFKPYEL